MSAAPMSPPTPRRPRRRRAVAGLSLLALLVAACGGAAETEPAASSAEEVPVVAVTSSIIGDLVRTLAEGDVEVVVLMPPGVDPHGYQPSADDGRILREADLIVANGLQLEENLVSVLETVEEEGGNVLTLADKLDPLPFGGYADEDVHGAEDDHADGEDHADGDEHAVEDDHADGDEHAVEDDHADGDDHDHAGADPHFWFDPLRTADAVELIAAELAALDTSVDAETWTARGEAFAAEVRALHAELETGFATIPDGNRTLVTNHDALGYLADRYDIEVVGTVIPGASTQVETDARSFAALIETVEELDIEVVFADNTDATVLAEQLASEVLGRSDLELEVVQLYTGSLGEPGSGAETYLDLMAWNASRIVEALGGSAA